MTHKAQATVLIHEQVGDQLALGMPPFEQKAFDAHCTQRAGRFSDIINRRPKKLGGLDQIRQKKVRSAQQLKVKPTL